MRRSPVCCECSWNFDSSERCQRVGREFGKVVQVVIGAYRQPTATMHRRAHSWFPFDMLLWWWWRSQTSWICSCGCLARSKLRRRDRGILCVSDCGWGRRKHALGLSVQRGEGVRIWYTGQNLKHPLRNARAEGTNYQRSETHPSPRPAAPLPSWLCVCARVNVWLRALVCVYNIYNLELKTESDWLARFGPYLIYRCSAFVVLCVSARLCLYVCAEGGFPLNRARKLPGGICSGSIAVLVAAVR